MERWQHIRNLTERIESAHTKRQVHELTPKLSVFEDDDFRIRMKTQADLLTELEDAGKTIRWGALLRAPDVYFEVARRYEDKLEPVKTYAHVRFGVKTGANDYFYIDAETAKQWGIEREFLRPVVKSLREVESLRLNTSKLRLLAFVCCKTKEFLRKHKKLGALRYIEHGEKLKIQEIPSVRGRKPWYSLGDRKAPHFVFPSLIGERYLVPPNAGVMTDKRFYDITMRKDFSGAAKRIVFCAVINSTLARLFLDLQGEEMIGDITGTRHIRYPRSEGQVRARKDRCFVPALPRRPRETVPAQVCRTHSKSH